MDYVALYQDKSNHVYRREVDRVASHCQDPEHATFTDGVMRWTCNGAVPPEDIVALAKHLGMPVDIERTNQARGDELRSIIARMRANDRPMSEEEKAEARAAHGPGAVIVNVITGRRTRL